MGNRPLSFELSSFVAPRAALLLTCKSKVGRCACKSIQEEIPRHKLASRPSARRITPMKAEEKIKTAVPGRSYRGLGRDNAADIKDINWVRTKHLWLNLSVIGTTKSKVNSLNFIIWDAYMIESILKLGSI